MADVLVAQADKSLEAGKYAEAKALYEKVVALAGTSCAAETAKDKLAAIGEQIKAAEALNAAVASIAPKTTTAASQPSVSAVTPAKVAALKPADREAFYTQLNKVNSQHPTTQAGKLAAELLKKLQDDPATKDSLAKFLEKAKTQTNS